MAFGTALALPPVVIGGAFIACLPFGASFACATAVAPWAFGISMGLLVVYSVVQGVRNAIEEG